MLKIDRRLEMIAVFDKIEFKGYKDLDRESQKKYIEITMLGEQVQVGNLYACHEVKNKKGEISGKQAMFRAQPDVAERLYEKGGKGGATSLERGIILGNRYARGHTIIPPDFEKYLSGELREEADKQKNARKLREELKEEQKRQTEKEKGK